MTRSRTRALEPVPKLPIWRQAGKLYFCSPEALRLAIAECGAHDGLIRKRMGYGYHYVADALAGKGLNCWQVCFLEGGIRPPSADDLRYYPAP